MWLFYSPDLSFKSARHCYDNIWSSFCQRSFTGTTQQYSKVAPASAHEKETGRGRKSSFHDITGPTFLDHNIVLVYKGAMLSNLSRGDV